LFAGPLAGKCACCPWKPGIRIGQWSSARLANCVHPHHLALHSLQKSTEFGDNRRNSSAKKCAHGRKETLPENFGLFGDAEQPMHHTRRTGILYTFSLP
jgi:hypothetical protein